MNLGFFGIRTEKDNVIEAITRNKKLSKLQKIKRIRNIEQDEQSHNFVNVYPGANLNAQSAVLSKMPQPVIINPAPNSPNQQSFINPFKAQSPGGFSGSIPVNSPPPNDPFKNQSKGGFSGYIPTPNQPTKVLGPFNAQPVTRPGIFTPAPLTRPSSDLPRQVNFTDRDSGKNMTREYLPKLEKTLTPAMITQNARNTNPQFIELQTGQGDQRRGFSTSDPIGFLNKNTDRPSQNYNPSKWKDNQFWYP